MLPLQTLNRLLTGTVVLPWIETLEPKRQRKEGVSSLSLRRRRRLADGGVLLSGAVQEREENTTESKDVNSDLKV